MCVHRIGVRFRRDPELLVRRCFDPNTKRVDGQRFSQPLFHHGHMRSDFRLLGKDRAVDVHDLSVAQTHLAGGLLEENPAGRIFPLRIGIWKKGADIARAKRAQHRVANRVHDNIRVRVAIEPL